MVLLWWSLLPKVGKWNTTINGENNVVEEEMEQKEELPRAGDTNMKNIVCVEGKQVDDLFCV